ncbi:MAG: glycosyltransferase [Hydrococcus sp. Prado102]|jgi:GT2 family glycosyltransferase|nr:glycosyltransferase [Hydrococcus sp. Prado102]
MTNVIETPILTQKNTQSITKLQNIILPNIDICTVEELFLRLNSKCLLNYEQNRVELKKGGKISLDTYFNAFSVQKWQKYTSVKAIDINLQLQGRFHIKLLNIDYFSQSVNSIAQKVITVNALDEISLFSEINIQQYKGLLYVEIEALEDKCLFTGGCFETKSNCDRETDEKFAIVICTYKRESYVNKNIQLLKQYLLDNLKLKNQFEIFIIDNGKTLDSFSHPKIHLIANKNTGGSGGFTRGILEVLERKTDFSHIIFMDDDVVIIPEAFERIYNFKKVTNEKSLCIGGSMLKLDIKYIQNENGAVWDDGIVRVKPDLDLRTVRNVLFNEIEEYINYNGWWLFCFPTKIIDESNLPYPFFIRGDDIELSLRLKLKTITLNGICVWHESFENKSSPTPNYYSRKNDIILSLLYCDRFSRIDVVKQVLRFSIREAFCYRYKSAKLVLQAATDLLAGPYYLKSSDPEQKNIELSRMGEKPEQQIELPFIYDKYEKSIEATDNRFYRWMRLITLNGHFLPSLLFHNSNKLTDRGYKIVPLHGYRPINVFRARKVLYYNLLTQEGFMVQISRWEFLKIFVKAITISWKIFYKFPQLKQIYRKTLPELTNKAFWESYLEIIKEN